MWNAATFGAQIGFPHCTSTVIYYSKVVGQLKLICNIEASELYIHPLVYLPVYGLH